MSTPPLPPFTRSDRNWLIGWGIGTVLLNFVLFDLLLYGFSGGGIFSLVSALAAARTHVPRIDVDGSALRTLFMIPCALFATLIGIQAKTRLQRPLASLLFLGSIIAGGYLLDGMFAAGIIGQHLADRGYARCVAGDHAEGNGKSRVWFDAYVLPGTACRAKPDQPSRSGRRPSAAGSGR